MLNALEPITISPAIRDAAARHMRLATGFAEDQANEVDEVLGSAVSHLEKSLSLCLIPRLFVWRGRLGTDGRAEIPMSPLRSVEAVSVMHVGGASANLPVTDFSIEGVVLSGVHNRGRTLQVTFKAGFGDDWSSTPNDLRHAVMLLAAHYFDNRHAAADRATAVPFGVASLIQPWLPVRMTMKARS